MLKDNQEFANAVVLTGGIATGKSTVASLFKLYGFLTIDADTITHKLLDKNYNEIENIFGEGYIENQKVLRKKLGKLIFNDKVQKERLENFIHPLIKKEIIKEATLFEKQEKPYLIDIPLFFEKNNYNIQRSIVVYLPKEIQIQRLMQRDSCSIMDAKNRIDNQMDIEAKKLLGTYIIDNSFDLSHLQNEVERLKKIILS